MPMPAIQAVFEPVRGSSFGSWPASAFASFVIDTAGIRLTLSGTVGAVVPVTAVIDVDELGTLDVDVAGIVVLEATLEEVVESGTVDDVEALTDVVDDGAWDVLVDEAIEVDVVDVDAPTVVVG